MDCSATKLKTRLLHHVERGQLTHFYVAAGSLLDDGPLFELAHLPGGRQVFDLASLTKPLVTSLLVAEELATNRWTLDSTVCSIARDLKFTSPPAISKLHVRSLLNHVSGLAPWRNYWLERLMTPSVFQGPSGGQAVLDKLAAAFNPERCGAYAYSDLGFILLGILLERQHNRPLDALFAHYLARTVGPHEPRIGFRPSSSAECVPTGYCRVRRRWLVGEVHDENCWALAGVGGHAGLFASGPGMWRFLAAQARAGLLSRAFRLDTSSSSPCVLGWQRGSGPSARVFCDGAALGHLGFTGTAVWVDPATFKAAILLSNRVVSGRAPSWIASTRSYCFQILDSMLHGQRR